METSANPSQAAPAAGEEDRRNERGALQAALAASVVRQQRELERQQNPVALVPRHRPHSGGLAALAVDYPPISRERRLKSAIQEAIDVPETTRRAFKSKQLAMLRKDPTAVATDTD